MFFPPPAPELSSKTLQDKSLFISAYKKYMPVPPLIPGELGGGILPQEYHWSCAVSA